MPRRMFRYVVPVDDRWYTLELTGQPVQVAAVASRSGEHWRYGVEFWAEHDDTLTPQRRGFRVYGTGLHLPDQARWVGTCPRLDGLVWHRYELQPEPLATVLRRLPSLEQVS